MKAHLDSIFPMSSRAALLSLATVMTLAAGCSGKSTGSETKIVGGRRVDAAGAKGPAYTSTVAITNASAAYAGRSYCTGTLVDDEANLVLSAAHCFREIEPGQSHYVFFGSSLQDPRRGFFRKVTRVVIHSGYDHDLTVNPRRIVTPSHDLALLRFEGRLPAGFREATLATQEALPVNILLAGFGTTGALRTNTTGRPLTDRFGVPLTRSDSGVLRQVEVSKTREFPAGRVFGVAGRGASPQGACPGDSGGPAYAKVGDSWRVFGVLSTGVVGGADTNGDGRIDVGCLGRNMYTDVRPYADWIDRAGKALTSGASGVPAAP